MFGGSGFVGSAVVCALGDVDVATLRTPRLSTSARSLKELVDIARSSGDLVADLAHSLDGVDVVVNAAGDPDASSLDEDSLFGANALVPGVLLLAARRAGVRRFVHVSSAVVQNDKKVLDASEDLRPFSPYSSSKVAGELIVRELSDGMEAVRYRPPSVHGPARRVTRMIKAIAASPMATVARPGHQATPQALLPNVAAAVAFLVLSDATPPPVVHHPSEGVTVTSLMQDLSGGRYPVRLPRWFATLLVDLGKFVGRLHKPTAANARRVELLWLGQDQDRSWLEEVGWRPPVSRIGWQELGKAEAP